MVNPSRWLRPVASLSVALSMVLAVIVFPSSGNAQTSPVLGTAASFSVLASSTVTNTGPSVVHGNLGISSGSEVAGFPPGTVVPPGTIHIADAVALQAQNDVTTAYNDLAGRAMTADLTGQNLGGMTLTPGVYFFSSSAFLTGTLTLNAQGDPDAEFIFQIGSTLITAPDASINVINGHGGSHCNVYWQVGSSATLDSNTDFQGNILAQASITLVTGAEILGRALARTAAVTMDTNNITNAACFTAPPDDDDSTPPDDDDVVTPPDDDDVVTPPDDDDVTPPDDDDVVTPPDDDDVVTPPDDDDVVTPPDDDDDVTPPDDDDVVTPPDDDDVVTPPDDDDVVTPPDDDDVVTPPDDDDDVTPPDDDDVVTTPDDDDVTAPVDNGDKGETPPTSDVKITLPKTGNGGFLADGSQQSIVPSGLIAVAALLLISGSVYIRTTRHHFE